jgi:adenine deaminase
MELPKKIEGVICDPISKLMIPGRLVLQNERIIGIERDDKIKSPFILPGFVDSHIHIESSMLVPSEFARIAKLHGTVAVVADPHEIGNVAGVEGINFMIDNSKNADIRFYFGAPSCVPAAPHEDCFEELNSSIIDELLERNDIFFLGEMMNFPGVIQQDADVLRKLEVAKKNNKKVDGHAPGLSNIDLVQYIQSGISTDHECFSLEEALEKISLGMKILIREGSAAKNYQALKSLVQTHPDHTMFCTDDCHPEDLIDGHINKLVKESAKLGFDLFNILQVACVNPQKHYGLDIGMVQIGDYADFIVVKDLVEFKVLANYIRGIDVLSATHTFSTGGYNKAPVYTIEGRIEMSCLEVYPETQKIRIINAYNGELITDAQERQILVNGNNVVSDITKDILKIAVVNRYKKDEFSIGFISGFGLKKGAIAESIAHDSHHIIAVGVDDKSIYEAISFVINNKGGLCYFDGSVNHGFTLPIYGLMSNESGVVVAKKYMELNNKIIVDGCSLGAPFMTLSFMALSVIPKLKITPRGLFDVQQFKFVDLFI